MEYRRLYTEFDFSDDDLATNRNGEMTDAQREAMRQHGQPLVIGFFLIPLLFLCASLCMIPQFWLAGLCALPFLILTIPSWWMALVIQSRINKPGNVRVAEGRVELTGNRAFSGGVIYRPVFHVGGQGFQATITKVKALRQGETLRVYYVPLMPIFNEAHILSVESLSSMGSDYVLPGEGMMV